MKARVRNVLDTDKIAVRVMPDVGKGTLTHAVNRALVRVEFGEQRVITFDICKVSGLDRPTITVESDVKGVKQSRVWEAKE